MIEKEITEILSKYHDADNEGRKEILTILAAGIGSAIDLTGTPFAEIVVENGLGKFQVIVNKEIDGKKIKTMTEIEELLDKNIKQFDDMQKTIDAANVLLAKKQEFIDGQIQMIYDLANPPEAICPVCQEIECDPDCSNPRASAILGVCNECYCLHCICEGKS